MAPATPPETTPSPVVTTSMSPAIPTVAPRRRSPAPQGRRTATPYAARTPPRGGQTLPGDPGLVHGTRTRCGHGRRGTGRPCAGEQHDSVHRVGGPSDRWPGKHEP